MAKKTNLNFEHVRIQSRAIAMKIYPEMLSGFTDAKDLEDVKKIKKICSDFLTAVVSVSDCPYWIHAIIHDSDFCVPELHKPKSKKPDELKKMSEKEREKYIKDYKEKMAQYDAKRISYFWNPQLEKIHIHMEIITQSGNATDLQTMINYLSKFGLNIREKEDTIGFMSGWVQKLNMKNKAHISVMVYHTHETDAAKLDGKYKYQRSDVFTNIPEYMLKRWYDVYFNCISKSEKASEFDFSEKAYQLGRNIRTERKSFAEYWRPENIPEIICSDLRVRGYAQQRYNDGISDYMKSVDKDNGILRCAIFIGGKGKLGKTVTSSLTLQRLGFSVFEVGTGTGKFDDLSPSHDAIVADDTSFPGIFDLADNRVAKLTRRHSGNPIFLGQWLVITYNGSFWEYLDNCYSNANWYGNPSAMDALHSRFYCLDVDTNNHNRLYLDLAHNCKDENGLPGFRGNPDELAARNQMLFTFMTLYNELILSYHPELQDKYGIQNLLGNMCRDSSKNNASVSAPASVVTPGCAASAALLQNFLDEFVQLPF